MIQLLWSSGSGDTDNNSHIETKQYLNHLTVGVTFRFRHSHLSIDGRWRFHWLMADLKRRWYFFHNRPQVSTIFPHLSGIRLFANFPS